MALATFKFLRRVIKVLILSACCLIVFYIFQRQSSSSAGVSTSVRAQGVEFKNSSEVSVALTNFKYSIYNFSKLLHDLKIRDNPRKLIDLQNFDYIMNPPACVDKIAGLIAVHSAPTNFKLRLILRETWGQSALLADTPLRLIFMLSAVANQTLQHHLQQENSVFGDLVQGNFKDHYLNMTYKHIMVFKWFIHNCGQAQILIKVDDDAFVNTPQLLKYLNNSVELISDGASQTVPIFSSCSSSNGIFTPSMQLFRHPKNLLFCQQPIRARVKRSYRSKWRVSKREYALRYYPPYCHGYSIIYSADVVLRLYEAAQLSNYFWIDDVHVTGILAELQNITVTSAIPFVLTFNTFKSVLEGIANLAEKEFIFAWPDIKESQLMSLWKLYLKQKNNEGTRSSYQTVGQSCDYCVATKVFLFVVKYIHFIFLLILLFISVKLYFLTI